MEYKDGRRILIGALADRFKVTAKRAADLLIPWLDRGVIRLIDDPDEGMYYRYVPPDPSHGPTHRPRGEPRIPTPERKPTGGGVVALTGKRTKDSGSLKNKARRRLKSQGKLKPKR